MADIEKIRALLTKACDDWIQQGKPILPEDNGCCPLGIYFSSQGRSVSSEGVTRMHTLAFQELEMSVAESYDFMAGFDFSVPFAGLETSFSKLGKEFRQKYYKPQI